MKKINSLELYLNYTNCEVVKVDSIEDIGCGIYPCYYCIDDGELLVSTSAATLIKALKGDLKLNNQFNPPDFYNNPSFLRKRRLKNIFSNREKRGFIIRKVIGLFHYLLRNTSDLINFDIINYLFGEYIVPNPTWYSSSQTMDKRVFKLQPFELKTLDGSKIFFDPKSSLEDKDEIIKIAATLITEFIQKIENKYPDYKHVVLTAGKDSQLIWLAPKINDNNWSCFTAQPNVDVVKRWFEANDIKPNFFFEDDNMNVETIDDVRKKIISNDLYSDIKHIRWLPSMVKIGDKFEGKCIFWGGTAADAIFSYYPEFHETAKKFYDLHRIRVSSWQGNYHQTFKNFTGFSYISPYHSEEIWKDLFLKMDPLYIKKHKDLRYDLGKKLRGGDVIWIHENPSPKSYEYDIDFDPREYYINYLKND